MAADDTQAASAQHRSSIGSPRTSVARILVVALLLAYCTGCEGEMDSGKSRRPNVLVFVLDAARADHFGVYGYERDTTPNIDAFAASAIRFDQAIAEASFTFASISALFTGLPPHRTGLLRARRLGEEFELLAEVAQREGYRTRAYSENPYVTPHFGFDRGFETFDSALEYSRFRRERLQFEHADPQSGIDAMVAFMSEGGDAPFFAYVHLLRPHNPYTPTPEFEGRFGSGGVGVPGSTRRLLAIDTGSRKLGPGQLEKITSGCGSYGYADSHPGGQAF